MSGFVFKIQANMDPQHRDRMAFLRICSGKLTRGMRVHLMRNGKTFALNAPQFFFAQERSLVENAWAGDVVGIPNHGTLRIGDTLTEGEKLLFQGVPSFAPEILRRVRVSDAMKAKKVKEALKQLTEEGVVQVFIPHDGSLPLIGVVGALQLDVLNERLKAEYGVEVAFETTRFELCRWISSSERSELEKFITSTPSAFADDLEGAPVYFATSPFALRYEKERWGKIAFAEIKEFQGS